jgi:WD40 repeat protein
MFELSTKAVLRSFKGHKGAVRVTKFSSNNTSIFTASDDNTIRIWDVASGTTLGTPLLCRRLNRFLMIRSSSLHRNSEFDRAQRLRS